MKQSNLCQIPVQIDGPIRDWTAAVVRNDKNRCVGTCVLEEFTECRVEPGINVTNRVAKLGFRCWIVKKMVLVHELPEIMLDCVDRHEDKHHDVLDPMQEQ